MKPLVSICMLTYNHENYISQAIESVLNQNTNFNIELVIGEDHSTDSTRLICEKYAAEFPDIIKLLPALDKNLGPHLNFKRCFSACSGTYIAMLEGDDYWTLTDKLQKQISFLELNQEYAFCSHGYSTVDEQGKYLGNSTQDLEELHTQGFDITLDNFFKRWYAKTLTTVYRKAAVNFDFDKYSMVTDTILYFNLLLNAKGYWFSFNAGAYRVHSNSMWSSLKLKHSLYFSFKTYLELFNNHPEINSLREALTDKISQIIDYSLHPDNRMSFSIKELLLICIKLYQVSNEKWETVKFLKSQVYDKLLLRFKIQIRKKIGIYPSY